MRFGCVSPLERRAADDLGRFGLGMKTASISQCRLLTVVSLSESKLSGCAWDLDWLAKPENKEWTALLHTPDTLAASPVIAPLIDTLRTWGSGTIVCWQQTDGPFSRTGKQA